VTTDLDVGDDERAFLDKVMAEFEIPESEWGALFPLMEPQEARDALSELEPVVRDEAIHLLLQAATVDRVVNEAEREYLSCVAEAAGIDASELSRRIDALLAAA
jgi:hypothetical protein